MLLFSKVIDFIVKIVFYIGVSSGIIMTLLVFASTLLRYLAGQPISFSDELTGLLFLTMAFTTFPYVSNKSGHIRLDLITNKMPPTIQKIFIPIASAIFITFAVIFAWQSWQFLEFSKFISSRTDVSRILLWPWMALMPISMILCVLVEIKKLLTKGSHSMLEEASL
ncbi:TRAP transporter small permease [Amphritea sp. 2_MG-2023]|uniref:TRAP transporter small permease n=1 Tax=Amphritea TaxID=515417 RepID=UPI001C067E39|nr:MULTISPECIES: TRAP transporter small permease [Amphritea]MBU2964637.1 TRAP transporter small permease [Amphritea atlantica]MDO6420421.1 TRAP transporter small permease [Amphritea sp. 2_MG-2023]